MLPDFRYRDSYVGISNALQLKFQKNKYAYYVIVGYSHFFCQHTLFITTHKGFLIHNKENEFLLIFYRQYLYSTVEELSEIGY